MVFILLYFKCIPVTNINSFISDFCSSYKSLSSNQILGLKKPSSLLGVEHLGAMTTIHFLTLLRETLVMVAVIIFLLAMTSHNIWMLRQK